MANAQVVLQVPRVLLHEGSAIRTTYPNGHASILAPTPHETSVPLSREELLVGKFDLASAAAELGRKAGESMEKSFLELLANARPSTGGTFSAKNLGEFRRNFLKRFREMAMTFNEDGSPAAVIVVAPEMAERWEQIETKTFRRRKKFSKTNEMSGFTERLIEDWLTKADERSYQLSFASCLSQEGHVVLYVSTHTALEHGKDLVTRADDGLHGYQLKAGKLDTTQWRKIEGEVRELAALPWRDTGKGASLVHRAHLVLTGSVSDPVRDKISLMNEDLLTKGFPQVEIVELSEIVARFVSAFENFFPRTIAPLDKFVQLYLSDGSGPQTNGQVCEVLESILVDQPRNSVVRSVRCASNAVVAAEFLSQPFRRIGNEISVIDTWVLPACQIVRYSMRRKLALKWFLPALELCRQAIVDASSRLIEEVMKREDFLEGHPALDSRFLPYRRWIAMGYCAAGINHGAIIGHNVQEGSAELLRIFERERPIVLWGEGAWNFTLSIALALCHTPKGALAAEEIVRQWLAYTCPPGKMWPRDPYWTIGDELSVDRQRDAPLEEAQERMKLSYSGSSAIGFLARRMRRQAVAHAWPSVSHYGFSQLTAENAYDYFRWEIDAGTLDVTELPVEGKWSDLREQSRGQRWEFLPDSISWILPYFLCTYPHRIRDDFSGELDYLTSPDGFKLEWVP